MKEVTQEAFARLLSWLGPDVDAAGDRYREIHRRLVRVFSCWGCPCPEELADRTLDRVAAKAEAVQEGYEGDPFAYVLGVARNVRREDYRFQSRSRGRLQPQPPAPAPAEERLREEDRLRCLDRCLAESLSPDERQLLLQYYREPRAASASRRAMADQQGLSGTTLRKRTQRYRRRLQECLRQCLGWDGAGHGNATGVIVGKT
jgi:DNA-directed RNA polymerase specialized sigma24 family protein